MKGKTKKEKKIMIQCGECDGDGQTGSYTDKPRKGDTRESWVVEDCSECDGKGKVPIHVIDERVKTKKEVMVEPRSY